MKKMFYIIRFLKIKKNTYKIVLVKNSFYEILGSYTFGSGFSVFKFVFLNKDRLFFWLSRGAGCELTAYKFLRFFLLRYKD